MKRIAIFAHYDLDNIIDQSVIFYLKNLKKVTNKIIFVSDGALQEKEKNKIEGLVYQIITQKHGEYDFGSHKRGFKYLVEHNLLEEIDELIFANDSCYCLGEFENIFQKMSLAKCDAWGMTEGYPHAEEFGTRYHLQSFFLVFRKTVFMEDFFKNFIEDISPQKEKRDIIIKYEEGLSQLLLQKNKTLLAGFATPKLNDFCNANKEQIEKFLESLIIEKRKKETLRKNLFNNYEKNPSHREKFYILLKMGCPLIKRRILSANLCEGVILSYFWRDLIKETNKNYNEIISMILNHLKRIGVKPKNPKDITQKNKKNLLKKISSFFTKRSN